MARRCGWKADACATAERVVWVRRGVATTVCPRSFVSAESEAWLEQFQTLKRFGMGDVMVLPARTVHAFIVLEKELQKEEAA